MSDFQTKTSLPLPASSIPHHYYTSVIQDSFYKLHWSIMTSFNKWSLSRVMCLTIPPWPSSPIVYNIHLVFCPDSYRERSGVTMDDDVDQRIHDLENAHGSLEVQVRLWFLRAKTVNIRSFFHSDPEVVRSPCAVPLWSALVLAVVIVLCGLCTLDRSTCKHAYTVSLYFTSMRSCCGVVLSNGCCRCFRCTLYITQLYSE